jgi:hypothetical protein
MPRYSSDLEVRFFVIKNARWQILDTMPSVADIAASGQVGDRDAWVFFVREAGGTLKPYYFDSQQRKIFPFAIASTTTEAPTVIARQSHREEVGNGIDREFLIQHRLNSWDVDVSVWEQGGDRTYEVECDVFKIPGSLNSVGVAFSRPPAVNQFEVQVMSGVSGNVTLMPSDGEVSGDVQAAVLNLLANNVDVQGGISAIVSTLVDGGKY